MKTAGARLPKDIMTALTDTLARAKRKREEPKALPAYLN